MTFRASPIWEMTVPPVGMCGQNRGPPAESCEVRGGDIVGERGEAGLYRDDVHAPAAAASG
ncbi:hypothetical protein GCM10017687_27650 [Streptomyces echinatus]